MSGISALADIPVGSAIDLHSVADEREAIYNFVRADALRSFEQLVVELGGDPVEQLRRVSINPNVIEKENAVLSYRSFVNLLYNCATGLNCASFGLQLAARQGGLPVLGPLEIAMTNSETVGEAYKYCSDHLQTYSPAVQLTLGPPRKMGLRYIRFDILLNRVPLQQQAVEHAVALMCHAITQMTNQDVHIREIWFAHEPVAQPVVYRRCLGAKVCFGKPFNAVFVSNEDFDRPLPKRDRQLYELATNYIDSRYPAVKKLLSSQVRIIGATLLAEGKFTHKNVAERIGMHQRTLQRRLRDEGVRFEELKDELRREIAVRYLGQQSVPLTQIASMLGYSEPSVFTRSCHRWFANSPRKVRRELYCAQ